MEKKKEQITIVLIKNYWEGFFQSLAWIAVLTASIGLAVWLDSTAMQWVMALLWFLTLIGWAIGKSAKMRMTPEDAVSEIQKMIDEKTTKA